MTTAVPFTSQQTTNNTVPVDVVRLFMPMRPAYFMRCTYARIPSK